MTIYPKVALKAAIALLFSIVPAQAQPVLKFDNGLDWKQVFDAGFRPKHFESMERDTCICKSQEFLLDFKNRDIKFKVGKDTVNFSFIYDDFLSLLWHQGDEAITLEEGKKRADDFRKVFDGFITQEMTMPVLIDPSGLVDAGNNENNIKAQIGEYRIWYGFDNSMGKVKPIIPHFYIAWSFPGKPDVRLKDARDVVRPPKGYEWYSLDSKISTPDASAEQPDNDTAGKS